MANSDPAQSTRRYRMVTPPVEAMKPQVGWTYELRSCRRVGFIKVELVATADGPVDDLIFDMEMPAIYLGQHFEEVEPSV